MFVETQQVVTTFKWTELIPALTPITLILAIWKVRGWIDEFKHKADEVYTQTTNHLPHYAAEANEKLTSIDKNISILVDRTK
jgi:hypothetical protein